jgi:hypothetical protein
MKVLLSIVSLAIGLLSAFPVAAAPTTVYLVLSPFYEATDRTNVCNAIAQLIIEAPLGTRFVPIDGWARQTLPEMRLPEHLIMTNSIPMRKKSVRTGLAHLLGWFNRTGATPAPPGLAGSAIINLPGALDLICAKPAPTPEVILVIASPLYHSLTEPQFSFIQPVPSFPSDAHLFGDPGATVFSIVDNRQRLHNRTLFLWFPHESLFATDVFRDRVKRFWTLYVSYQGGTLAGFESDANTILGGLFEDNPSVVQQYGLDPAFNRIEMLSIVRTNPPHRTITNDLGQATFTADKTSSGRPTVPAVRQQRSERFVVDDMRTVPDSKTAAGILWDIPGLDLDIYVWQSENAMPLFFGNTRTPEGYFVHDYRDHNDQLDYEKVLLDVPPASLGSLRVAVNFYEGQSAQPVTGKVFVRYKGVTYAGAFGIAARQGNKGEDALNRANSPYWSEIKVDRLQPVKEERADALH